MTEELATLAEEMAVLLRLRGLVVEEITRMAEDLAKARANLKESDSRLAEIRHALKISKPRKPKPEKPKRGRKLGSKNKAKAEASITGPDGSGVATGTNFPSEAEIRAAARCINPTTGQGCGKLLADCTCGADLVLPQPTQ